MRRRKENAGYQETWPSGRPGFYATYPEDFVAIPRLGRACAPVERGPSPAASSPRRLGACRAAGAGYTWDDSTVGLAGSLARRRKCPSSGRRGSERTQPNMPARDNSRGKAASAGFGNAAPAPASRGHLTPSLEYRAGAPMRGGRDGDPCASQCLPPWGDRRSRDTPQPMRRRPQTPKPSLVTEHVGEGSAFVYCA